MVTSERQNPGHQIRQKVMNAVAELGTLGIVLLSLAALGAVALIVLMSLYLPQGIDWHQVFRPAARELLAGRSPFRVEGYLNAPWALLPLIPLAVLPESVGRALHVVVSLGSLAYVAHRLGARPPSVLIFLLSPPVLHGLLNGNIDWLVLIGVVLPPQIGFFFIAIKPQVGVGVAVFWVVEAWREGGIRRVIGVSWPIAAALLISFAIFGLWPLRFRRELDLWWNASLWPTSIPVGLTLLVAAIRRREIGFALGAGPCLSPYVLLHAWVGALIALVKSLPETTAAVVGLWVLVLIRASESGLLF